MMPVVGLWVNGKVQNDFKTIQSELLKTKLMPLEITGARWTGLIINRNSHIIFSTPVNGEASQNTQHIQYCG